MTHSCLNFSIFACHLSTLASPFQSLCSLYFDHHFLYSSHLKRDVKKVLFVVIIVNYFLGRSLVLVFTGSFMKELHIDLRRYFWLALNVDKFHKFRVKDRFSFGFVNNLFQPLLHLNGMLVMTYSCICFESSMSRTSGFNMYRVH